MSFWTQIRTIGQRHDPKWYPKPENSKSALTGFTRKSCEDHELPLLRALPAPYSGMPGANSAALGFLLVLGWSTAVQDAAKQQEIL